MWVKGMPLGPEHFQQHTLYLEQLIKETSAFSTPLDWGILNIELDLTNLSEGILKIQSLQGLNENKILFNVTEENDLRINLRDYKNEFKNDKAIFVYVSTPKNHFTPQTNESFPRYSSISSEVPDLNNKLEKNTVQFLTPNYKIEIGDSASLKSESIAIAQIKFNGMSFEVTNFTPPTIHIQNSQILKKTLNELIAKMKTKLKFLKHIKNPSREVQTQLVAVANMLFSLEGALQSNDHPYRVFLQICNCVSNAFVFAEKSDLPNINGYNHNDITASFMPLINYINVNLESIYETFQLHAFSFADNRFELELRAAISNHFLIAIKKGNLYSYEDISNWISTCLIATEDKIESIKEERSRGCERTRVDNYQEYSLPEIPDMVVVKVTTQETAFSQMKKLIIENQSSNLSTPNGIYLIEI